MNIIVCERTNFIMFCNKAGSKSH